MRNRSLPASFAVALLLAAPPLAQAQSMLNFGGGGSRQPGAAAAPSGSAAAKIPPPPALPGAASTGTPAPVNRAPVDMQPNDALFDAINRGDIATARDAISRGADLQGQNILGMTPLELSIDLGRNDISFLLLSMRAADDGRGSQPTAALKGGEATTDEAGETGTAPSAGAGCRSSTRPRRRRPASTAATVARRTRMPGSWGSNSGRR